MGNGKIQYIPVYADTLKAMRDAHVSAEQLGRALYAVLEEHETGARPDVAAEILLPFVLLAQKYEESIEAYNDKVKAGREAAAKRYNRERPAGDPEEQEQETGAEEPADDKTKEPIGTHSNPKAPIQIEKNRKEINKNKNIKEKINKKEKGGGQPRARNGTNQSLNYQMRNDDLKEVLMEL